MLSFHLKGKDSNDEGFSVENKECWLKLVTLLSNVTFKKEIKIEKSNSRHETWIDKEYSIGTLNIY